MTVENGLVRLRNSARRNGTATSVAVRARTSRSTSRAGGCSAQQLGGRRLVEPDDQRAPLPHGGRAQVAGGAEQQRQQLGARGGRGPEGHVHDLLAPPDAQLVHLL